VALDGSLQQRFRRFRPARAEQFDSQFELAEAGAFQLIANRSPASSAGRGAIGLDKHPGRTGWEKRRAVPAVQELGEDFEHSPPPRAPIHQARPGKEEAESVERAQP